MPATERFLITIHRTVSFQLAGSWHKGYDVGGFIPVQGLTSFHGANPVALPKAVGEALHPLKYYDRPGEMPGDAFQSLYRDG